MVTEKHHI